MEGIRHKYQREVYQPYPCSSHRPAGLMDTRTSSSSSSSSVAASAAASEEQGVYLLPQCSHICHHQMRADSTEWAWKQDHMTLKAVTPKTSLVNGKGIVKLAVYVNSGMLTVNVMQARHLQSNFTMTCNSYIKVSLVPDDSRRTWYDTVTAPDTNHPLFNEKFSFELLKEDLRKRLLISAWNFNMKTRCNEFLGCMSFGIRHICLQRTRVKGWYYLLKEDIGRRKHLQAILRRPPVGQESEPDVKEHAGLDNAMENKPCPPRPPRLPKAPPVDSRPPAPLPRKPRHVPQAAPLVKKAAVRQVSLTDGNEPQLKRHSTKINDVRYARIKTLAALSPIRGELAARRPIKSCLDRSILDADVSDSADSATWTASDTLSIGSTCSYIHELSPIPKIPETKNNFTYSDNEDFYLHSGKQSLSDIELSFHSHCNNKSSLASEKYRPSTQHKVARYQDFGGSTMSLVGHAALS